MSAEILAPIDTAAAAEKDAEAKVEAARKAEKEAHGKFNSPALCV
jgi:hypothetical protein